MRENIARSANGRMRQLFIAVGVLLLTHVLAPLLRADDPITVKDFLAERSKWPRLQGAGLTIEGRWSIFTEERLLLTKCDLVFLFDDAVRVPASKTKNVEVSGSLTMREGMLVFLVTRLKLQPSDIDYVADRRARLETNAPEEWYALAEWAARRGAFYEDETLLKEAVDLNRTGVIVEYRQVPITAIRPLYDLAEKAESLGLSHALRDQIVHDALRRELQAARRGKPGGYNEVMTHVLEKLPGSDVGLALDAAVLEQQRLYQEDPLALYEKAEDEQRRTLHRLLYVEAALEHIESGAADDGRNGFEIARRIEQTVPEFADLAEQYRLREIDYQIEHVPKLSRENLLTLTERLEAREQGARAEEVKRRWLDALKPRFRERGINGQLDLADEYIQLLGDEAAAAEIYREIFDEPAGQELARTKLVELGYRYNGDDWIETGEDPDNSTAAAILQGIVREGMTDDQVQAALAGKPSSVVRFASRGQITELWVYPDHDVSIRFNRRSPTEARIAAEVSTLSEVKGN